MPKAFTGLPELCNRQTANSPTSFFIQIYNLTINQFKKIGIKICKKAKKNKHPNVA